jgi:hypothetical protein
MQSAFNSGPLQQSLPAIAAGEPLVGILLGVLIFGDRIQITPGELALQAGGVVALIIGVIMVGRAPALSQLRHWAPPSLPHIADFTSNLPSLHSLPGRHPAAEGADGADSADRVDRADAVDGQSADHDLRNTSDTRLSGNGSGHLNSRAPDARRTGEPADHPNP